MKPIYSVITLLCVLGLSACPANLPPSPETPEATASPSMSPSITPTPTPTPLPSVDPSASPSSEASATPEPTPSPSSEASPLPTQTAAPATNVSVQFRAAFVNTQREVVPAANTEFKILPYPLEALRKAQAVKNNAPEKPVPPDQNDPKYQRSQKVCTSTECTVSKTFDSAAYQADVKTYEDTTLPAWESQAYQGLDAVLAQEAQGRTPQTITTDANGEADLNLLTGRWYVSGSYTWRDQIVIWDEIARDIREDSQPLDVIL